MDSLITLINEANMLGLNLEPVIRCIVLELRKARPPQLAPPSPPPHVRTVRTPGEQGWLELLPVPNAQIGVQAIVDGQMEYYRVVYNRQDTVGAIKMRVSALDGRLTNPAYMSLVYAGHELPDDGPLSTEIETAGNVHMVYRPPAQFQVDYRRRPQVAQRRQSPKVMRRRSPVARRR